MWKGKLFNQSVKHASGRLWGEAEYNSACLYVSREPGVSGMNLRCIWQGCQREAPVYSKKKRKRKRKRKGKRKIDIWCLMVIGITFWCRFCNAISCIVQVCKGGNGKYWHCCRNWIARGIINFWVYVFLCSTLCEGDWHNMCCLNTVGLFNIGP